MAGTRPTPLSHSRVVNTLLNTAQSSYYKVTIPVPGAVVRKMENNFVSLGTSYENINLLCCEASLPGSQLSTIDITNNFHGVTEKHVNRRIFDDRLDLTFYVDAGDYTAIRFFEYWVDYITNASEIPENLVENLPPTKSASNYFENSNSNNEIVG